MVVNGNVKTFVFLNFEKEEGDGTVAFPPPFDADEPSLEQISIKRLKCVEKGCYYPYISMSFIRAHSTDVNNNSTFYKDELGGMYECLQTISELKKSKGIHHHKTNSYSVSDDGYLIFAYKTMEDMYNTNFVASWKTWTGARLLCNLLPEHLLVKRLSFFKKIGKCNGFTYIMIAQIKNLMLDCAPALNVLHCMKPKICAVVGAYRGITFKVNPKLLSALNVAEEDHVTAYASKLKVMYSNNTAAIEFPDYLEFREDETSFNENKSGNEREKMMVSEETQTVNTVHGRRRMLPRTISIYDFPSMQAHAESTIPFKVESSDANMTFQNGVIDDIDCPVGCWKRRNSRQDGKGHVVFLDALRAIEKLENDFMNEAKSTESKATGHEKISVEKRGSISREDSLLSRLKEKYFNSPDFSREEIMNC